MRPSPSVVRLAADRSPGFLGLPWSFSRRSPSVLVLLLVGRRGAATLRHRLTAHGAVLLVQRVDLDVVPGGPVDEGLDLGRGGVHALGGDVEVDRDRPGHALLPAGNGGGGGRGRGRPAGRRPIRARRCPGRANGGRAPRRRSCWATWGPRHCRRGNTAP